MLIYDSLSQKKAPLPKPKKEKLNLFVCGPTVYDYSHIGHARTYVIFDAFVKYLKSCGINVFYLQNITDIDDKIIARAKENNIKPLALARKFEKEYFKDLKSLKITSVTKYARATEFIPQIINQIQRLIEKGYAYKIDNDGYYFDVSAFSDYGKLSRRTSEQAEDAISRIDQSVNKRNKADFVLWKFYKEGEPFWNTPLGKGRPGWHIEDTAITEKFFGPQYDIHGGGVDLKFPHHEAEIAQQEAASGKKPLVKIWIHTGFLLVNGEKMSKSLHNFITIQDFLKNYPSEVLRMMVFSNHYRSPFNYTEQLVEQTRQSLKTIEETLAKLKLIKTTKGSKKINLKKYDNAFNDALKDDFNTPQAFAIIFELISAIEKNIWDFSKQDAHNIGNFIKNKLKIFEIEIPKIPKKINDINKKIDKLRNAKEYKKSDELRVYVQTLGYETMNTSHGTAAIHTINKMKVMTEKDYKDIDKQKE